jgi:hypothetical protein
MISFLISLLLEGYNIPEWHYEDIYSVAIMQSDSGIHTKTGEQMAEYSQAFYTIRLYRNANQEDLIHEIGHHIWFISNFNKELFGKPPYISNYANVNKEEDFAETYMAYYVDRKRCGKPLYRAKCKVIRMLEP